MSQIPPGRIVLLADGEVGKLAFPPPTDELVISVHPAAGRAPGNRLTLAVWLDEEDEPHWVGAIDERMIAGQLGRTRSPRSEIAKGLGLGDRCWDLVWPGPLLRPTVPTPYLTLYDGDRPWVVLGELAAGPLLAAPLNDARGNPKWFAPRIPAGAIDGAAEKDGQLELAHVWTLPRDQPAMGGIAGSARRGLLDAVVAYYE